MTDAELIARLRDWPYQGETMANAAADRIEALTKEWDALVPALLDALEAARAERDDFADQIANLLPAVNREAVEQRQRAEVAEAKLAKAIGTLELIQTIDVHEPCGEDLGTCGRLAHDTLVEIKGGTNDQSAA